MTDPCRFALAALGLVSAALAQTTAPADELGPLRNRTPGDADRRVIAQWIDKQVQAAATNQAADLSAFRKAFLTEHRSGGNEFKQALADLSAEAFAKAIADPNNAQGRGGILCAVMMTVLAEMNRPTPRASLLPTALAGLLHKMAVVREQAARALARTVDQLQQPADIQRILTAAQTAAMKEGTGPALREMYNVLGVRARAEDGTRAVAAVMKARLPAYQERNLLACIGEVGAAAALERMFAAGRAQIQPETQRLAVQRLAEILSAATQNYIERIPAEADPTEPVKPEVHDLELTIDAVERALTAIVKAMKPDARTPSVAVKMKSGSSTRGEEMRLELSGWIGTPQTPGTLTQAPFNLPVGLPDARLAPATATAPTTAPR